MSQVTFEAATERPIGERSTWETLGAALILAVMLFAGCTPDDPFSGGNPFKTCGNDVIDKGEECDDGSANSENADCLTTCVLNRCGDEFVDLLGPDNIEVCDGRSLAGQSCLSQGFVGGTLACEPSCAAFDTSGCTLRPTPTVPGLLVEVTPTPPPTATATASPTG
jgi:hypothetical protein